MDGNGYLCMSSTGYTLQGWQVDPTTGDIRKDIVSPLQVMSPQNQTAAPEATTKAYVSGVLDKKDTNVTSEDGYTVTLDFSIILDIPIRLSLQSSRVRIARWMDSITLH